MQQTIEAVRHGTSVAATTKQFKRITLLYKVKGIYQVVMAIADAGFPATRLQFLDSVQISMQKLNRPNKFEADIICQYIIPNNLTSDLVANFFLIVNENPHDNHINKRNTGNNFKVNDVADHFPYLHTHNSSIRRMFL
ncbi:hypothetical protein JTB14_009916 [Gonioctena quinquepunctata]|nr:hypothetical protein JTB14_009916 [Gonioctena quinquepunctata]